MKISFFVIILLVSLSLHSQRRLTGGFNQIGNPRVTQNDSTSKNKGKAYKEVATIDMYLQLTKERDTTLVDTSLTIQKDYKFNYLQRDEFGLMPFANMGQTYNALTFDYKKVYSKPLFGARARHFNYMEVEDMHYYKVPTPWTRLTYKTAFQQGQMLDAFFTVNLNKQFNFSIAYKGLRSLGNYQHVLTSTGNFRVTTTYTTKNNRYQAKGHITTQDLLNQENGGLTNADVINFQSGNPQFDDRPVFDPNFENAESILLGKRFYLNHHYNIIQKNDSLTNHALNIEHTINFEDKYFEFTQTIPATTFFGNAFTSSIHERTTLEHFTTQLAANYTNEILGHLKFGMDYTDINYGYNSVVSFTDTFIPNRIKTNFLGVTASYAKTINTFKIKANAGLNLSNDFEGNYINSSIDFDVNNDLKLHGEFNISNVLPNYNFLLYQSDYINYNWNNYGNFSTINTQQIKFKINSEKYVNTTLDISNINNFTFFNLENTTDEGIKVIKPKQYDKALQYLRLKVQKELRLGNFALDNTILYQNVVSDDDVLNLPELVLRNTLYYSNYIFKKAMKVEIGTTLNYFTAYNMNGYDPVLAEFYTQNQTKIGNFPRLDFFINAKVRQTRVFLKAEHFNSSLTGFNFFAAPNHPYRDFTIRFGLVWDFFL